MFTARRLRPSLVATRLLRVLLSGVAIAVLAGVPAQAQQEGDPPAEVARVSVVLGNVSMEPASVDQFTAAGVNDALTTGDRIYTDTGANAELETGQVAVRMGQQTDLTVTSMIDPLEQFGLAQGSVHLRSFRLNPGTAVELDTPNAAVTVLQPGDVRVDVDPEGGTTTVELFSGQVQVDANGFQQVLEGGQSVQLQGSDPVTTQVMDASQPDGLDGFSNDRDMAYQSGSEGEDAYVNPATIGAEDLNTNGDWESDPVEGAVWYPTGVAVGWVPYSSGRWTWMAPWGWTWVESERWGFAPFHYGRWEHRGNRWGWIPGAPVVRPIYSPAMVAFVGGPGVTAWFALGPHDAYVPWYHASAMYENRLNVSNQYDRDFGEVRAIYNQPTLASAYEARPAHGYVNRSLATVAVTQASFAAGRPVGRYDARVNADVVANAPVVPHPLVTPERAMVVGIPTRAIPPRVARPTLALRVNEIPARPTGFPAGARSGDGRSAEMGVAPISRPAVGTETSAAVPVQRGMTQGQSAFRQPEQPQRRVIEATNPVPSEGQQTLAAPVQRATPQGQMLFHQSEPPQPRPSFEEQQRAIETTDPGRPLGPQQMENLRQNRPAGPPQQPESQHPAPRPMPRPLPPPPPRSAPPSARH